MRSLLFGSLHRVFLGSYPAWALAGELVEFYGMDVMLLLGGLIVFAQGSAVAPFIYTLF